MNSLNAIPIVLFVIAISFVQWLLMGKIGGGSKGRASSAHSGHIMEDMKLSLYKEGHRKWDLKAKLAESYENGKWTLQTVDGKFINEKDVTVNFTGERGRADLNNKTVNLNGDVNAKSTNGYKFKSDALDFYSDENGARFFSTEDRVKISNEGQELEVFSTGLKGNIESGEVDLLSAVSCKKSVKKYKDILIKSDYANFKSSLKGIRFSQNLRISQEKFNIKGKEAYFLYDEANKNLKSVQIDGDILASDGVKTALSDRVEMRTNEDVIIFQGNPRIRVGKNEMVGEEILITNKQKNVQVIRGNIKSTKEGIDIDE